MDAVRSSWILLGHFVINTMALYGRRQFINRTIRAKFATMTWASMIQLSPFNRRAAVHRRGTTRCVWQHTHKIQDILWSVRCVMRVRRSERGCLKWVFLFRIGEYWRFCVCLIMIYPWEIKWCFFGCRDAQWEGSDVFYNFEQQGARQKKCVECVCRCPQGRYHFNDKGDDSPVFCLYCGSNCVHRGCMVTKDLVCQSCSAAFVEAKAKRVRYTIPDNVLDYSGLSDVEVSSPTLFEKLRLSTNFVNITWWLLHWFHFQPRPKPCYASDCKSVIGRDQFAEDDTSENSPELCLYCRDERIHKCCLFLSEFSCNRCTREIFNSQLVPDRSQLMRLNAPQINQTTFSNNSIKSNFTLSTIASNDISFSLADDNNNYTDAKSMQWTSGIPKRRRALSGFRIIEYSPELDKAKFMVSLERKQTTSWWQKFSY